MSDTNETFDKVLLQYGLSPVDFVITPVGTGYIHRTYRMSGRKDFILQRVNKNVFKKPEIIASNLRIASDYLASNHPDYLFLSALNTTQGKEMAYDDDGFPWRIFPYFQNTYTIDKVSTTEEAFSAAAEFGRLTNYLDGVDVSAFKPSIERFHDLQWRYDQFEESLVRGKRERFRIAATEIIATEKFKYLVDTYRELRQSGILKIRITHNDTKINNILFDTNTKKAVTAIDLDTLMQGYFIYDVGDMIRTFVSPVDEEEKDLDKVIIRPEIYQAIVDGYLSQMGTKLSPDEKKEIPFAGMMMTYIMALRMLTDFLNGDIYYNIRYDGQNLVRAKNQFRLLQELEEFFRLNHLLDHSS